MSDEFCQALSLQIGEPLAGTAVSETDRWLLLEHDGPWGPRGIEDSGLPEAVTNHLAELASTFPRLRVQLIRRPGEPPTTARLFLAESGERAGRVHCITLARVEELLELTLAAWLEGGEPPGEAHPEPLYLVCVHAKRDRCCARLGMPVFRALDGEVGERVFQTTHLGGHRFAATLLVLPFGLSYGRVAAEECGALIAASERGEIFDLARLRGRTAYPSEAQAAEVLLRAALEQGRSQELALLGLEAAGEQGVRVRFRELATNAEHVLFVRREALPAVPQSCGAKPKAAAQLIPLLAR